MKDPPFLKGAKPAGQTICKLPKKDPWGDNFRSIFQENRVDAFYPVPFGTMRTEHYPGTTAPGHEAIEMFPGGYF